MLRLLSGISKSASIVALAACSTVIAQDIAPAPIASPRNDVYSIYNDAYFNPESCRPTCDLPFGRHKGEYLFSAPRHSRWYMSNDFTFWGRTKAQNKILTSTSPNLFDGDGQQITPDGLTRFQPVFDPNGLNIRSGSPNDLLTRINVNEFLIPRETRLQTNDFDWPMRGGIRPTIGVQFGSGSRVEFTYHTMLDFKSKTLRDDVQGAAFFVRLASFAPGFAFQRFGYINSPFRTTSVAFGGEARRDNGLSSPHDPLNEDPPYAGGPTPSSDVPGETTIIDTQQQITPAAQLQSGRLDERNNILSLLWEDGELAIADYHFNMQAAELAYRQKIFEFHQNLWKLELITSVRYVGTDEGLSFFFADTTFDRAAANPDEVVVGLPVPIPAVGLPAQPAQETWATIDNVVRNDLLGPEIGLGARYPIWDTGLEFDLLGKFGFLANFMAVKNRVFRGDGLLLYDYEKDMTLTSGIFEGKLGLNYTHNDHLTMRCGFEWMYLMGVGTGPSNLNYNLDLRPRPNNNDNLLFYGVSAGAEIKF